jgi:hypothetical protein
VPDLHQLNFTATKIKEEKEMLSIPLNGHDTYAIFGVGPHLGDKPGAMLRHGQTVKLESSNPHIVTFGPDHKAKLDKDGVQTIASGNVAPVHVGGPVEVTATVMNADGSLGHCQKDTITVTTAVLPPDVPKASGDLFKVPLSLSQKAVETLGDFARPSGQAPSEKPVPAQPIDPPAPPPPPPPNVPFKKGA